MADTQLNSVAALFVDRTSKSPDREAFLKPVGASWQSYTWKQIYDQVRAVASGLRALGLQDEERVSILSGTRLDWIVADLGIMCAAGATTTIYPSSTVDDISFILNDSGSKYVFAEDASQLAKLESKRKDLPQVRKVIMFEGAPSGNDWVISLEELQRLGKEADAKDPAAFDARVKGIKKDALATLIYTSGTTGQPKGVELTHDNWIYEAEGLDGLKILSQDDKQYLWLPLAHSFGKVLEVFQLKVGFPTAVDGRVEKMVENLAVIKPTFVCAVPRVFEKVHNKVVAAAKEGGGLKAKIFTWAMGVGKAASRARHSGQSLGALDALQLKVADRLVFSKLRNRFGGNVRFFISGSAALSMEMSEFFDAAGLPIFEGYGLTETSAGTFVNHPGAWKFGTVGPPLAGTEVKIAKEDGEVLLKGRGVMRGYHNLPEATKEVFTPDGFFRTGDIGELDDRGLLRITDRKKDLIKTSNGKYVAPQGVEGKMKAICPHISQVLVHGNNRSFCVALVAFDPEAINKWAAENGHAGKSYKELVALPAAKDLLKPYFNELNKSLPPHEQVKDFAVLPADLTQDAGDLTPSLKLKRKAVEQKYKGLLDAFYAKQNAA